MPNCLRKQRANPPDATRAAVSRALARSRVSRQSVVSHLIDPARSAWPGRGRWTGGASSRRESLLIIWRSEEHTSELQSRLHLVCRLLLEKKKKKKNIKRVVNKTL